MPTHKTKYGISTETLYSIISLFSDYSKVSEVILFGSRAQGNYSTGSDIDFSIKGEQLNVNDILTISNRIDDLYLPYHVDIIIYNNIKESALINHIDKYGITLFKR